MDTVIVGFILLTINCVFLATLIITYIVMPLKCCQKYIHSCCEIENNLDDYETSGSSEDNVI
jgi:hypothetical protein